MAEQDLGKYYYEIGDYKKMQNYYFQKINDGDINAIYSLRAYYLEIKCPQTNIMNYDIYEKRKKNNEKIKKVENKAIKILSSIAIKNDNINLMSDLVIYFDDKQLYDEMIKFSNMILEKEPDHLYANLKLAYYYKNINNYQNMIKHFLIIISHPKAMVELIIYYDSINDYEEMSKYNLLALDNPNILCHLAFYYESIKNFDNMIKYYLMAIEQKYTQAMYYLGNYYENQKNYNQMRKYYMMAIQNNINDYYFNIINKSLNKIKECQKCFNYNNIIKKYNCGHYICQDCFNFTITSKFNSNDNTVNNIMKCGECNCDNIVYSYKIEFSDNDLSDIDE